MTPGTNAERLYPQAQLSAKCGINAIIFQVRPEADAFYKSDIEPWSRFYTGRQGLAPAGDFDVTAFLIEECHKRNMEFHAWLTLIGQAQPGIPVLPIHIYIISIRNGS